MLITALETTHLVNRDTRASDAEAFYAYMQREHYWRDLPIDPPTPASIAAMVNTWLLDQAKDPRIDYCMAATDKASGQVIGEAILHIRSISWRQGEIGWGVNSAHIGRGFATEIGSAMLRLAFDNLDLHRVYAKCRMENQASRRIMAKLGMLEEGMLCDNGLLMVHGSRPSNVLYWPLIKRSIGH